MQQVVVAVWLLDVLGIDAPSTLEIIFIACAVFGSAFFIIMMTLMLLGGIVGGAIDTVFDADFTLDTDLSFELFTLQGLSAAIMMFGLVGMFSLKSTDTEVIAVFAGGIAAIAALYAMQVMLQAKLARLQQMAEKSKHAPPVLSGTNMQSVVNVLDKQKANAEKDAQLLRRQLDGQLVSESQMATMQEELANLQQMVADSEHVKQQMEQEMEDLRKSGGDASLEMQDSVIGGDSMVGSTKIEKQIINDPEAIARAAVEAYRMAKDEDSN